MEIFIPCSICGMPTNYRCADCAIGHNLHPDHPELSGRKLVAVCESPECRDKHEKQLKHQTV